MCGRYNIVTNTQALIDAFEIIHQDDPGEDPLPDYNISPSDSKTMNLSPIVYMRNGQRHLKFCCWPFLPAFAHAIVGKYCVANAMVEKLDESKVYGHAWHEGQRCLVPASGFYEWQVQQQGGPKQPWLVEIKNRPLFAMAGVWGLSSSKDGSIQLMSFAIITMPANPLMAEIHNDKKRMPAILQEAQYKDWLSSDNEKAKQCIKEYPDSEMKVKKITTYLNNPHHKDQRCIEEWKEKVEK